MQPILDFSVNTLDGNPGKTVPKARPRERGRLPKNYEDWKKNAISWLTINIVMKYREDIKFPLSNVGVCILFSGTVRANADLDNAIGSWMDALKQAGILLDDNVLNIPVEYSRFIETPKTKKAKALFQAETRILIVPPNFIECPFTKADIYLSA